MGWSKRQFIVGIDVKQIISSDFFISFAFASDFCTSFLIYLLFFSKDLLNFKQLSSYTFGLFFLHKLAFKKDAGWEEDGLTFRWPAFGEPPLPSCLILSKPLLLSLSGRTAIPFHRVAERIR